MAKKATTTTTAAKTPKARQTTKQRLLANFIHWPVSRVVQGLNWALAADIPAETDPAEWMLAQEERLLADGMTFDAIQVMAESNGWSPEESLQVLCGYVDQRAANKLLTLSEYLKQIQGGLNARGPAPAAPSKNPAEFDLPPGAVDSTDLPAEPEPVDDQDLPGTEAAVETDEIPAPEDLLAGELPSVEVTFDEADYASWLARLQPHWAADNQEAIAGNTVAELDPVHFSWPAVPTGEGLLIVSQLYSPNEQQVYLDLVAGYEDAGNFIYLLESSQRVEQFPETGEVLLDQLVDDQSTEDYGDVLVRFNLPQLPVAAPAAPTRAARQPREAAKPAAVAQPAAPVTTPVKPVSAIGGTRTPTPTTQPAQAVRTARTPTTPAATSAARTTQAPVGRTPTAPTTPSGRIPTPTTRRAGK